MADTITVNLRTFASLREALKFQYRSMAVPAGCDVAGLLARLAADFPAANLTGRRLAVAVNRTYAPPERVLEDGDEVSLIPPVSGGAAKAFEVVTSAISLDDVAARVVAPDLGGITVFAGTVRSVTRKPGEAELQTDYLEYESYPEMAEESFAAIATEARARWPGIAAVAVVHRVGRLEVGETAIAIAVAAAHRRDTFDACHYIIDRIKGEAPIWKREVGPDGTAWVEGPESAF